VLRGIKTFIYECKDIVKMVKKVAAFLNDHPKVKTVYFVGLKSHPFHEIPKK
jgi:cystathionine beta-lyase